MEPIEIHLGSNWVPVINQPGSVFMERIATFRKQHAQEFGLVLPRVRFKDSARLSPDRYEIHLDGVLVGKAEARADRLLAIHPAGDTKSIPGEPTRDPTYGLPALWIDESQREAASLAKYTLVDAATVFMTHLTEMLRRESAMLLTRAEVDRLLARVRQSQPGLVEELIPTVLSSADVQKVLQNLLKEKVSIRHVEAILETLADAGRTTRDASQLTEIVRQRLGHAICQGLLGEAAALQVLTLDPAIESQFLQSVQVATEAGGAQPFVLDPRLTEQLMKRLVQQAERMMKSNLLPGAAVRAGTAAPCALAVRTRDATPARAVDVRSAAHDRAEILRRRTALRFQETPMTDVLAISLQSMQQDMARLERISMNMANATTPGYKREVVAALPSNAAAFSDAMLGTGLSAHADALDPRAAGVAGMLLIQTDARPGTLKSTGQNLDVALATPGFFEISTEAGLAYTRQGSWQLDARGRLVTAQGHPVMGTGGEIVLSRSNPVIDAAGRVFESRPGGGTESTPVAQLKVVQFDNTRDFQAHGRGPARHRPGSLPARRERRSTAPGFPGELQRELHAGDGAADPVDAPFRVDAARCGRLRRNDRRRGPSARRSVLSGLLSILFFFHRKHTMFDALYISATGMQAQQLNVDTIANNLANVNTTGFKKSKISFTDLMVREAGRMAPLQEEAGMLGAGSRLGAGVGIASTSKLFDMGDLKKTESAFDIAIQGEGFLEVTMPDGSSAFTRGGTFKINRDGLLRLPPAAFRSSPTLQSRTTRRTCRSTATGACTCRSRARPRRSKWASSELVPFHEPHGADGAGRQPLSREPGFGRGNLRQGRRRRHGQLGPRLPRRIERQADRGNGEPHGGPARVRGQREGHAGVGRDAGDDQWPAQVAARGLAPRCRVHSRCRCAASFWRCRSPPAGPPLVGPPVSVELRPQVKLDAGRRPPGRCRLPHHPRPADAASPVVALPLGPSPRPGSPAPAGPRQRWRAPSRRAAASAAIGGRRLVSVQAPAIRSRGASRDRDRDRRAAVVLARPSSTRPARRCLDWLSQRSVRAEVEAVSSAPDLLLPPGAPTLRVRPLAGHAQPTRRMLVWVDAWVDDRFVRSTAVTFEVGAWAPVAVAETGIERGARVDPIVLHGAMATREVDLTTLRQGTPVRAANGGELPGDSQRLRRPLRTGEVLTRAHLEATPAVVRGNVAHLLARSGDVSVESRVEVLQDGREGQLVRVKVPGASGEVLARVTGPGQVEVQP